MKIKGKRIKHGHRKKHCCSACKHHRKCSGKK